MKKVSDKRYDKICDLLLSGFVTEGEKLEIIMSVDNDTLNRLKTDKII